MAFGLKSFGFKGRAGAPANLPDSVRQALESWRASSAPALDEPHFHTRYVVIDVATSGPRAEDVGAPGPRAARATDSPASSIDRATRARPGG